jgi:hypothetical protein
MLLLFVVVVGVAGDAVVVVVVGFGVCVEWRCPCRCFLYCERGVAVAQLCFPFMIITIYVMLCYVYVITIYD